MCKILTTVSGVANYFGKSNYGTYRLDEQRKIDGIGEGIKSHSETRFSSSYKQVVSVQMCMDSIKKCIRAGTLKFETAAVANFMCLQVFSSNIWLNRRNACSRT